MANVRLTDHLLVAQYTVTSKDAVGQGRFGVSCDMRTDTYRVAYASFQVRAPGHPGTGIPGHPSSGGGTVTRNHGTVPIPTQIDTGLGGTAGGVDPVWLLLPAGLLLIALAGGIWLRQATARRRR